VGVYTTAAATHLLLLLAARALQWGPHWLAVAGWRWARRLGCMGLVKGVCRRCCWSRLHSRGGA